MANIKSAAKRARVSIRQHNRNVAIKSSLKTVIKRFEQAAANDEETATEKFRIATKHLDKAAAKGIIHKNEAARRKSRLAKKIAQ